MQSRRIQKHREVKALYLLFSLVILFLFSRTLAVAAEEFDCGTGKHDYAAATKQPTEEEDGEMIYTCKICGFSYSRILPATGHVWGEWILDKQPTCTETGHKYRTCIRHSNDPHTEEESIPAPGHSYKETVTHPICAENGFKTYTCERCGDSYTEPFGEALGHHYIESTIKEPDCEQEGEKMLTCENCGDTYSEAIPAFGHSFSGWIVDKEPTEEEEGYRYKVCEHDSSHIVAENIKRLLPPAATEPGIIAMTESSSAKQSSSFPNALDIILVSIILATAIGFGIAVYQDLHVLRWKNKEAISYRDWLKKYGW